MDPLPPYCTGQTPDYASDGAPIDSTGGWSGARPAWLEHWDILLNTLFAGPQSMRIYGQVGHQKDPDTGV